MPRRSVQRPRHKSLPWGWLFGIAVAALLIMVICAWVGVQSFLRSAAFRRLAEREAGRVLGVEGTLSPLSWGGDGVFSERFDGRGDAGPLKALSASELRASLDYSALKERTVRVTSLHALRASVDFGTGKLMAQAPTANEPGDPVAGGTSWWRPRKFALDEVSVDSADLSWPGGNFVGTRLRAVPQEAGAWKFDTTDGSLNIRGLPPMECKSVKARFQNSTIHLLESSCRVGAAGEVLAEGALDFNPGGAISMQIEAKRVPLTPFLPKKWSTIAGGEIGGTMALKRSKGSLHLEGDANLDGSTLKALPVLDKIALFTNTDRFRSLVFQRVRGHYVFDGQQLSVTGFDAESPGLVRLEGRYEIAGGKIDGTFEVGVSPATLRWLPGAQGKVFTASRDGYLWTTVHVSGPLEKPSEDLSARLVAAMPDAVLDGAAQGATEVQETLKQGAKGVLDILLPTVP